MNKMVKLGGVLMAIMLVFGLTAVANAAVLGASITAPTNGASYTAGQSVTLTGAATGGTGTYSSYRWSFSDGTTAKIGQSQTVSFAAAGSKVITLTVTDSNGDHAVATANVTVTGGSSTQKPVITAVAAGNITQTSVTITWTTDIAASSRVIYDTTSHPDITGATPPNFGYAASTPTTDDTTKVTSHSVTISGLNPGTHYYFRVISQS